MLGASGAWASEARLWLLRAAVARSGASAPGSPFSDSLSARAAALGLRCYARMAWSGPPLQLSCWKHGNLKQPVSRMWPCAYLVLRDGSRTVRFCCARASASAAASASACLRSLLAWLCCRSAFLLCLWWSTGLMPALHTV